MELMPQLWDIASQLEPAPDPSDIAAVAAAEHARVSLADRVRGSCGEPVRLRLSTGTPVVGTVAAVYSDGLVVDDPHATWVVPLQSVTRLDLDLRAPVTARGRERARAITAVRDLLGGELVVATCDQLISRVRPVAVAADHLVVASDGGEARGGVGLIPWEALSWVRSG